MKVRQRFQFLLISVFFLALLYGCEQNYSPKPRGFFRIDLPEKRWVKYDSLKQYDFEYPHYAEVIPDSGAPEGESWLNIEFPALKATLHISYKKVDNDLNVFVEDAHTMAMKHLPKANSITDSIISVEEAGLYGILYKIGGKGVASPLQFFVTDSTNHFVRGALYFNFKPNNDSIAPVIQFVKSDVLHFIQSIQWKEKAW
jgi:gliding motility-associated lipoprotein GldD